MVNILEISSVSAYIEEKETNILEIYNTSLYVEYREGQIDVAIGMKSSGVDTDGSDRLWKDTTKAHSGDSSQGINVNAGGKGVITEDIVIPADNSTYLIDLWLYGTTGTVQIIDDQGGDIINTTVTPTAGVWSKVSVKGKGKDKEAKIKILSKDEPAIFNLDDLSIIPCSVNMTVIPTDLSDSQEDSGIRVGGGSTAEQAIQLSKKLGILQADFIPRHSAANAVNFGNSEAYFFDMYQSDTCYIRAYWSAANTITLAYNAGSGEVSGTYDATGDWDMQEQKTLQLEYNSSSVTLKLDGVLLVSLVGSSFPSDFTTVYWGSKNDGTMQYDGVIL